MTRAYWNVHGHEILFLGFVFATIIGFAAWEIVKFSASRYTSTFGYGVVVAKACTGALYPTFFFMMSSMSRYFTTMVRRSRHISRFFNLDLSMNFHIYLSCLGLLLATVHATSHLSGTFVQGSKLKNTNSAIEITGNKLPGRQYMDYINSVPGFTGIVALGLFYILALLSIPFIRRRNYNVFQVGHLLVYPITGFMMAHGTVALLQQPIFGYILAFPTFLVLFERLSRLFLTFYHIEASLEVLSDKTVELTAVMPKYRLWDYTAGQYVLLQVPAISYFQWHPFTISYSSQKTMKLLIKTDGDWTSKLRDLGPKIQVGINGPFGAPAQRFNDFQNAVIIGAGIGVTPFSAILADLQQKSDLKTRRQQQQQNSLLSSGGSSKSAREAASPTKDARTHATKHRRIDFQWIVRDHHYISWLSNLLNEISRSQMLTREPQHTSGLDIRISTHFTAKYGDIVTYIFSWLLEMSRTEDHPASLLTGLLNATYFGRPDFDKILEDHYERMRKTLSSDDRSNGAGSRKEVKEGGNCRVGVFYSGAAEVGVVLADKCNELSFRRQNDGSKIEYYFMVEVF